MKRLLLLLFFIPFISLAQVPQGVGYQGVATDANGIELVNQAISIRASILSASANGTVEWEETHATSTDTFGLFTLTIGQGTSTGNGVQLSFSDISWGTNTHYLKIEMDVTGGANYSFMGTNQMMSVPYALYAESANINYDSISNLLSNDSTFITNVGGEMGGSGCDFQFPEGLHGEVVLVDLVSGNYTVPAGKNFYITSTKKDHNENTTLTVNGLTVFGFGGSSELVGLTGDMPYVASPGDIISYNTINTPNQLNVSGLLINKNIDFLIIDLMSGTYTVPSGKKLYITSAYEMGWSNRIVSVNGQIVFQVAGSNGSAIHPWVSTPIPYIAKSGDVISSLNTGGTEFNISGYLVDENYFAGCGGGGSSGNSNSNTSGPNQTIGIGSITDLNDFDKEYDMFNAQLSGPFGNEEIHIHTDQLKNIYIIGSYSSNDNNSIGGIPLYSGSGATFFIAKYDSTGVIISVISEPVGPISYNLESSMVDNFGNIFVGGRLRNSYLSDDAFIRKYSTTNLTFVDEEICSSNPGYYDNQVYDIVSDGSGGVYLAGSYKTNITIGGIYLAPDQTNHEQGFVFHWNSSGNVPWANSIGDINESNLDDFASSIIIDQNNDLLVAGSLKLIDVNGDSKSKYFIKRYDAAGTLITTVESTECNSAWNESWGIKINTDNNGNIYLFTAFDNEPTNFAFNSFPLDPIVGISHILYKMDINFSVLNAINFGTGQRKANQIITLSNNDVILRSLDMSQYIIDNNVYLQDVNQYGNITHLDSNNSFIKFHTIGNNIGTQDAISITSDANTIYCLYNRVGTFINNGTNHPTGYYVVKEQY
jgi:hypothetical protein